MKPRLQLKPKSTVRVSTRMRLIAAGAALAILVTTGFFVYDFFYRTDDARASDHSRLPGYAWRKSLKMTLAPNTSGALMRNFPVFVQVQDPDLKHLSAGGKVSHRRGFDIRFTKADGFSMLPSFNEVYDPQTGKLGAWVLLDSLRQGESPELFLYFSNSAIQADAPNLVFQGEYAAVFHLHRNLHSEGTLKVRANHSGTIDAEGQLGDAKAFNATNGDYADYGYQQKLDLPGEIGLSCWIYPDKLGKEQVIAGNMGDAPGGYRWVLQADGTLDFGFSNAAGQFIHLTQGKGEKLEAGKWNFVAATWSKEKRSIQTYVNGISDRSMSTIEIPASTASAWVLGNDRFRENVGFSGRIDEFRISAKAWPQSWLAAEYQVLVQAASAFRASASESMQLDAASLEANRKAMKAGEAQQLELARQKNTLEAQKSKGSEVAPATVSSSAQIMQQRMNRMRDVSAKNGR